MIRYNTLMAHLQRIAPKTAETMLQIQGTNAAHESAFTSVYWRIAREDRIYLYFREAYNIYTHLTRARALGGLVAEVGVFKGGGAKLIAEFKGDCPLHLFDTFEGMPETRADIDTYEKGAFSSTSLKGVSDYLSSYKDIFFHPGIFPASAKDLPEDAEFCFVHLDVDIYESTLAGLNYFYPRLKKGGVIISHDYNTHYCRGVKQAFDEYFAGKGIEVLPLWDTQCLVRKA